MNIASTLDQPYQLCAVIYLGMLGGVLYTAFSCIRSFFKAVVPRIVCDILFSLCCFMLLFTGLYIITSFDLRLYHFTGLGGGFLVFTLCVKPLLRYVRDKVYNIYLEIKQKRQYNKSRKNLGR